MIRAAAERGLLDIENNWFSYRELRNITSHVYDPAKADKVFAELAPFLDDVRKLLSKLKETQA